MDRLFKGLGNAIHDIVTLGGRLSDETQEWLDEFEVHVEDAFEEFKDEIRQLLAAKASPPPKKEEVKK